MNRLHYALMIFTLPAAAHAGVALDMVSKDLSGAEKERSQIYAQDGFLRLDSDGGPFAADVSLIFDGSRFLVVDHGEQTYIIMDEAMLTRMTDKMNEAMEQMKAELASLPPEQRAMAEQMMARQMPGSASSVGACRMTTRRRRASKPQAKVSGADAHAPVTTCSRTTSKSRRSVPRRWTRLTVQVR